jgi:hypothetical protein
VRRRSVTVPAIAAVAVLLALLGGAGAASARVAPSEPGRTVYASKLLWTTINVCDTAGHPDGIGIRGSMPGSGDRRERMFMRFQVQYFDVRLQQWHNTVADGDSGFLAVGSARFRRLESGRTFTITPPPLGSYLLRGVVTFEWRQGGEVVRRARKRTAAGHPGTPGSDPPGFTAAVCEIT